MIVSKSSAVGYNKFGSKPCPQLINGLVQERCTAKSLI